MKIGLVGAGIVGRLLAWHLCQANHEVHLFTKGSSNSEDACSRCAAGMISPFAELPLLSLYWHKVGLTALTWWPKILASLPGTIHYQNKGTLVICHPKQKSLLLQTIAHIQHKLPHLSVPILSPGEIQALEPAISGMMGCHLIEAQISPDELFSSMNQFFATKKVCWHSFQEVTAITSTNIISNQERYEFDITVDCRGMGAKQAIPGLRGVRGEIMMCHSKEVILAHSIRILHPRMPCYIVPRENQQFALGATQIESESTSLVTMRSAFELLGQALHYLPEFQEASIIKMKASCRPTMPDHHPIIDKISGVITINGMSRHGLMLAPAITAQVANQWINKHDKHQNKFEGISSAL